MKDYTLSEIKAHCNRMTGRNNEGPDCDRCEEENLELYRFCIDNIYPCPRRFEVEPRDMIELPCKLPAVSGKQLQVVYRDKCGCVRSKPYDLDEEPEADTFLADLKGGKR